MLPSCKEKFSWSFTNGHHWLIQRELWASRCGGGRKQKIDVHLAFSIFSLQNELSYWNLKNYNHDYLIHFDAFENVLNRSKSRMKNKARKRSRFFTTFGQVSNEPENSLMYECREQGLAKKGCRNLPYLQGWGLTRSTSGQRNSLLQAFQVMFLKDLDQILPVLIFLIL